VTVQGDQIVESNETYYVNLTNASGATFDDDQGLGTINNNDAAELSIDDVTVTETEGAQTATFTVSILGGVTSDTDITFDYATQDNTAVAPGDYTAISTTQGTITALSSSTTIDVTVQGDQIVESNETYYVNLTNASGATFDDDQGLGTINNNDAATLTVEDISQNESAGDMTFTATLSAAVQGGLTVDYDTSNNTATTGDGDYDAASGTLTFAGNASETQIFSVTINDDAKVEADETFDVSLNTLANLGAGVDSADIDITDTAIGTILNDDSAEFTLKQDESGDEDTAGTVTFTIELSNPVDEETKVAVATTDGTAKAALDSDYTALSGYEVTFAAESQSETFEVDATADNKVEEDEDFTVALGPVTTTYTADVTASATTRTGTILDDDMATFTIDDAWAGEPDGPLVFTLSLDNPLDIAVTIDVTFTDVTATAGDDYTADTQQITFTAGDTADKTVSVPINDDAIVEDLYETFSVHLGTTTPLGTRMVDTSDTGTGTIVDDDTAEITIAATTQAAEDATNGEFTLSTTKQFQSPVTVDFTLAGSTATPDIDYASIGTSVVFPALSSTQTIPVTVSTDTIVEANETVVVTLIETDNLYVGIGDPNNATVTITDNDSATVSIAAWSGGNEQGPTDAGLTVTQTAVSSTDTVLTLSPSGTALYFTDYNVDSTVTIPAGSTYTSFFVDVWDDTIVEDTETVIITIAKSSGDDQITVGTDNATIDIVDDDSANVTIAKTTDGDEAGPVDGLFTVTQTNRSSTSTALSYSVGGTATSGDDYTALSGSVTISAMETDATITVPVLNDILDEGTETVILTISITSADPDITVTTSSATIDILDNDFTIWPIAGPGGSISPDTDQVLEYGGSVTFTITPEYCNYIDNIEDNGVPTGGLGPTNPYEPGEHNDTTYTVSNVAEDHTVEATFGINTHKITSTAETGGFIVPEGPQTVNCGTNQPYTITPDTASGYNAIKRVLVDGEEKIGYTSGSTTYTFEDVTHDHTIDAVFEDHGNDCSSATLIPVSAPSSLSSEWGKIMPAGDWDYFKLVIPSTGILKAYTTGTTDTFGYLTDSECNIISEGILVNDDISGQNSNFRIVVQGITAGTYHIAVKDYFPDQTGDYKLWVDYEADDHGSSCDTATLISCGGFADGEIVTEGDYDYFRVELDGDGILTAWTEGETDTRGILLNSGCIEIDQQDFGADGNNFQIQETLDEGIYHIAVAHSSTGTGSYTLHVQCQLTYNIYANAQYGGVISPSGSVPVPEGGNEEFIITCTGANDILELTVDDIVQTDATGQTSYTYTFSNVTSDHNIIASFGLPSNACVDISEIPLDARFQAAPANIMFVLDDSGSMDWEILTQENDGLFSGKRYIFDNPGDNLYSGILSSDSRMYWKSQWADYNRMYYDPTQAYKPWPTLSNADRDNPKSHPKHTTTFNINDTYRDFSTGAAGISSIIVDNQDANFSMSPGAPAIVIDDEDPRFTKTGPTYWGWSGWKESTNTDQAYNSDYYYTDWDSSTQYTATWTPPTGTYSVTARWDDNYSRPTSVPYTINHSGGTSIFNVDQSQNGGKWVPLGSSSYVFDGATDNVTLSYTRWGSSYPKAVADAVQFNPVVEGWDWATSDYAHENHYYYTPTAGIEYSATWTPNIVTSGNYTVYAKWDASSETYLRSISVPYKVTYSGGFESTVNVDQRQNSGLWVELGQYPFDTGTSGNVSITYTVTDLDHTICADAVKFESADTLPSTISIKNSHYYVWSESENRPYLVNLVGVGEVGEIEYYYVDDDGDNKIEEGEMWPTETPPDDVIPKNGDGTVRTYAEEKQNFANWYSYYRRRELTAAAAISQVITGMSGVNIGISSINGNLVQPVLSSEESGTLLNSLYNLTLRAQGTPLRKGLQDVGEYFHQDDGKTGGIGSSPYATAENGGECQQTFAILMTDGYESGSSPYVGNVDGDDGVPYADIYSNSIADVAMYYYENDLSSSLNNLLSTSDADPADWQHMVTYTVSFGVSGTLDPEDYDEDLKNKDTGEYIVWPNHSSGTDQHHIDDMWHAAVNGRGKFLSASNPAELISSLISIMQSIEGRIGSASSVSVNGDELYETLREDIKMFQASYNSDGWTGDVRAYDVDDVTGEVDMETYAWSAAEELESLDWGDRLIITSYYDTEQSTQEGIPFREANLTEDQKALLENSWDESGVTSIINFLRGDSTNEEKNNGVFRSRSRKLGDIVHSSPSHVNGILYTGGNDGMLHAFAADDNGVDISGGQELFAYVPDLVFQNLINLADPNYGFESHAFFVDVTPSSAHINRTDLNLTTMLAGGLGKGGKGYYALDISGLSNEDFSTTIASETDLAGRVMWEYPNADTPLLEINDLGYSYSRPSIVMSNAPDTSDSTKPRWIVIFGNGYNSETGVAKLIILDAVTGTLLKKIDTQVGGCNGLSTPVAIDVPSAAGTGTFDSRVDYVFAGDLKGNLWKFDLTSDNPAAWDIAYSDGLNPKPLFQATGPGGIVQPITTKPDVMMHPDTDFGYFVLFGTGRYYGDTDLQDTSVQTIYGIWDYGDDSDDDEYIGTFHRISTPQLSNMADEVTLMEQEIISCESEGGTSCYGDFWLVDGKRFRIITSSTPDWKTTTADATGTNCGDFGGDPCDDDDETGNPDPIRNVGWFFDLPESGERVVSDVLIREGNLVVVGYIPKQTPCGAGGDSIVMELEAATGSRASTPQFDINSDGVIDYDDFINIGTGDEDVWVAPTGIERRGRLLPPAILKLDEDREIKYFSSSLGVIETVTERAARTGISYWKEYE
jgi:type IV pilus assembly protein PilY1